MLVIDRVHADSKYDAFVQFVVAMVRLALKSAHVVDPAKELSCIAFTKGPGIFPTPDAFSERDDT